MSSDEDDEDDAEATTNHKEGHLRSNVYEVDRLLKRRKLHGAIEYKVRWSKGYADPKYDSWEQEGNVGGPLIAEFEESLQRPPAPDATPLVLQDCPIINDTQREMASDWIRDIGVQAVQTLVHAPEAFSNKLICRMRPCPSWLVVAIHTILSEKALELEGVQADSPFLHPLPLGMAGRVTHPFPLMPAPGPGRLSTTPIVAKYGGRGGRHVVYRFKVRSTQVMQWLMRKPRTKQGAENIMFMTNRTTIALLGPWTFDFRTQRAPDAATELQVREHFIGLVDGQGRRTGKHSPIWEYDLERSTYSDSVKHTHKVWLALALHRYAQSEGATVPAGLVKWLTPLIADYL
jgi:hypothetical protein